ncbi:hypothetical protein D3874_06930 [Oleomonas cavernae]|uniref:Uncharacterized protein n=1 Tax=Oleomonas cavernae TaxID=2320859 RepID=A0A418WA15_9PROT|nr:hypothetical protein [Oleomonas cavernae]RJF86784.1 hypothetical protein D3874_06930 [Oleomonas cavernae]
MSPKSKFAADRIARTARDALASLVARLKRDGASEADRVTVVDHFDAVLVEALASMRVGLAAPSDAGLHGPVIEQIERVPDDDGNGALLFGYGPAGETYTQHVPMLDSVPDPAAWYRVG